MLILLVLADKILMYDFPKGKHFNSKCIGNKSTRDRTFKKLLKSPAIRASGISNVIFLSLDSHELL